MPGLSGGDPADEHEPVSQRDHPDAGAEAYAAQHTEIFVRLNRGFADAVTPEVPSAADVIDRLDAAARVERDFVPPHQLEILVVLVYGVAGQVLGATADDEEMSAVRGDASYAVLQFGDMMSGDEIQTGVKDVDEVLGCLTGLEFAAETAFADGDV